MSPKHEVEKRYLTHEQLHRPPVASGGSRTFVFVLGYCGLRFGEAAAFRVGDVNFEDAANPGPPIGNQVDGSRAR